MDGTVEGRAAHQQVCGGLSVVRGSVQKLQTATHGLYDPENAVPGGIDAHILDEDLRIWYDEPGDNEISRPKRYLRALLLSVR